MKVLILHNDFRVYWKGRLIFLHEFLGAKDIELHAIELFGKGSPYSFDNYENKEQWWTCLFPDHSYEELSISSISKNLFHKLDQINPDIIIGGSIVFFAGALGIRWAKNNKKKFIMFDDAKPSQIKRNFVVQTIKDLIIEQIDGLWLPSKDYDEEYKELTEKNTPFFYGYNCIDNKLFKFKEDKKVSYTTIICVARLVPIKNINGLLKAWKLVEEKDELYKLVIIGDGPEYETLNNLSTTLKLKRVVFLGAVLYNDIPTYLYNSDAFVLPSLSESWGLVVNEAMAAGLPILLSNRINASKTLLKEGVNGYDFDSLCINNMSDKILTYINLDVESKKNMSTKSLEIINSMDYENMGNELYNAVIELDKRSSKKPGYIASIIINLWNGRYNTSGWNKL